MQRIYLVHRWDGTPGSDWYLWLKEEVEKLRESGHDLGIDILEMPNTEKPVIDDWINYLKKTVPVLNENIFFVAHSIGCQAVMRYLDALNKVSLFDPSGRPVPKKKIGGALFVAGWFNLKNLEGGEIEKIAEPWCLTPIDFNNVKNSIGNLRVLLSDNDPYDCVEENTRTFRSKLGAKVFVEENKDHFTESRYPEILSELLKILRITAEAGRILP